jgi:hypothetical protein
MRETLWWSRLVMIARRWPMVAPHAAPSLAAKSGEISMLASPEMPYRPNSERLQRSPHTRLMARVAPSSTSLYGQTFALALITLDSPILQKSPMTTPSDRNAFPRTEVFRPTMASLTTAPGPTSTSSHKMLPSTSAPSCTTTRAPTAELATRAPGAMVASRPMTTPPPSFAV